MKSITLYKPNGDTFRSFKDVSTVVASGGTLKFRFERKPGDRSTLEEVETSLPFILNNDLEP
jgi:hypothetical protein